MSTIEPRTSGLLAKAVSLGTRIAYGREMRSAGVYANHPRMLFAFARFNRAAERGGHVPKALLELASLRAATVVGCEYCMDIGSELARRSGLRDEQLLALHDAHESGLFSDDELLVIDLATGMSRTPGEVSEELMGRVRARFGVKGALELAYLIAWENTRARLNTALHIAPDGFSEGRACAIAAGVNGSGADRVSADAASTAAA